MVKIRLTVIEKSPFQILPGAAPNLILTQKAETLMEAQKSVIYLPSRDGIPEIHQAYYISGPIKVITLIQMNVQKSLLYHRENHISISFCVHNLLKYLKIFKNVCFIKYAGPQRVKVQPGQTSSKTFYII